MKKLGKLKLKELGKSIPTLDIESLNNIKGGGWVCNEDTGWEWSYMLEEVTIAGYDPQYNPYYNQPPIDLTPAEKYSKACAEGYTNAAKGLLAFAWGSACAVFCYAFPMFPDTGSLIVSYTNFEQ
jgi:natural product precursor